VQLYTAITSVLCMTSC